MFKKIDTISQREFLALVRGQLLSQGRDVSLEELEDTLNAIKNQITHELTQNRSVVLTGFGRFFITRQKGRQGRNLYTGETLLMGDIARPRFSFSKRLVKSHPMFHIDTRPLEAD